MSIYLLFAIGFKGGAGVATHGVDATLIATLVAALILSFALPFIAFALLGAMTRLGTLDRAAVAAHYGSISIVTFVAATSVLESQGIFSEGYMVAAAAGPPLRRSSSRRSKGCCVCSCWTWGLSRVAACGKRAAKSGRVLSYSAY